MDTNKCPICGAVCGPQNRGYLENGMEIHFCCKEHQQQFEEKNQKNLENEVEKKNG